MTWRPWRWSRTTCSSTGMNDWCGHSPHLTFGFSQTPGFHSLAQAGAYPFVPFFVLVQSLGNTSTLPRKRERKSLSLSSEVMEADPDPAAKAVGWEGPS